MTERELLILEQTQNLLLKVARMQIRTATLTHGNRILKDDPDYQGLVAAIRSISPGYNPPEEP